MRSVLHHDDPQSTHAPVRARVDTDGEAEGYDLVNLVSADGLDASFVPRAGMACCSLRDAGRQLIGERYGVDAYARGGATMGMSLIHPWADRLSGWSYCASGKTVHLPISPLLHTDDSGLPVNGVHPTRHAWRLCDSGSDGACAGFDAELCFDHPWQLDLFPFAHRLSLHAELRGRSLTITVEIQATGGIAVPVCFGYRLYLRREPETTIVLPARRRIVTDERLLPTGRVEDAPMRALTAGAEELREVYAVGADRRVTIASGGRRLTVEPGDGYGFTHVRTVPREPHVVVEALSARPDALRHDLFQTATPDRPYRASLSLSVGETEWEKSL